MQLSRPRPTKTLLALLLVGTALSAVPFGVADVENSPTYTAHAFDPSTEAHVLAAHSGEVDNLTDSAEYDENRVYIERAIENGSVIVPDSANTTLPGSDGYGVYRGEYYRVDVTRGNATEPDRFGLDPRTSDEAMDDLAVPYGDSSAPVREIVDSGNGTITSDASEHQPPSVVERNGTYYAIGLENPFATIVPFLATAAVGALERVGHVYLGVAVAVLGTTSVVGRRRALTFRSATGVAAVAFGAHVVARAAPDFDPLHLLQSLSTGAFALAAMLGVGVALASSRRRWLAVGVVFGAVFAGTVRNVVITSPAALFTGPLFAIPYVVSFGIPVLAVGYLHGPSGKSDDPTE